MAFMCGFLMRTSRFLLEEPVLRVIHRGVVNPNYLAQKKKKHCKCQGVRQGIKFYNNSPLHKIANVKYGRMSENRIRI